ncbi:MAG: hypothetical protein WC829_04370 [Hyphomicrobium sp.]|jgi:hypothetical protein
MTSTTFLPKGYHVHHSSGLRMDGTYAKVEPAKCGICKAPEVYVDRDNAFRRVQSCDACGAVHVITKGDSSWWYHDWKKASDINANWARAINSDER